MALPRPNDPRLLVGIDTLDDAGVFVVADDLALVQTVDFFAPIVDDPYSFGQVAAANALSDVYAMGGEPLTALNIVGFPTDKLPMQVLADILRGADEKIREAGAIVVGGHSVIDDEVKFGLAVTGRVNPRAMLTNAAARAGDRLVLTKPIGTGLLATAAKRGEISPTEERALIESMATLNREASRAARDVGARCATDITGFGLLGHASHVARASGVTLVIRMASVPVLPGAREAVARGERVARLRTGDFARAVAFSPDGSLIATGDYGGRAHLWSTETWRAGSPRSACAIRARHRKCRNRQSQAHRSISRFAANLCLRPEALLHCPLDSRTIPGLKQTGRVA
jgi:selenide, water dikinase